MSIENNYLNQLLLEDFNLRKEKNKSFSMRSYAHFLDVDSSLLSKILKNKRSVSLDFFLSIKEKLIVDKDQIKKALVKLEEDNIVKSFRLKKASEEFNEVAQSEFQIIADWKHYGFLDLLRFSDYRNDLTWFASKLGTSSEEIKNIIENLERTNLLTKDAVGNWIDNSNGNSTHVIEKGEMSKANQIYQKELLDLAKNAMDTTSINYRDQSSMMMAISKEKVHLAKPLIKEFRRKLCSFLEDTNEIDSLYQLSISLFPLTEVSKQEDKNAI